MAVFTGVYYVERLGAVLKLRRQLENSYFYRFLTYTLIFLLANPVWANTIQFKLKRQINIRQESEGVLKGAQTLPAGTVVEIPAEFVPEEFKGEKRDEMALLQWLRSAAGGPNTKRFMNRSGRVKRDFFATVRVVSSPDNKRMEGTVGEIAIRYLARKSGLELVTVAPKTPFVAYNAEEQAKILATQRAEIAAYKEQLRKAREARLRESQRRAEPGPKVEPRSRIQSDLAEHLKQGGDPLTYVCSIRRKPDPLTRLENDLESVLDQVKEKVTYRVEEGFKSPEGVIARMKRTCKVDNFIPNLVTAFTQNQIPPELMFPMMHAESGGSCDVKDSVSESIGLFQINTASSSFIKCGAGYANRYNDPKCLENPETNLNEAIRIMRAKYRKVNGQDPPPLKKWTSMTERERDYWRKALAAYNGGEGYIYQAYHDIKSFNQKFSTSLDPHDWRVRRLFMFRRGLEENGAAYFDNRYRFKRSVKYSVWNVAHTETILGVEPATSSSYQGEALIDRWIRYMKREKIYLE